MERQMFHRERSGFSRSIAGDDLSGLSQRLISNVENVSIGTLNACLIANQSQHLIDGDSSPQKVLDWLSSMAVNYRSIQNDTFSKHTAGTGAWFIEHPKFQNWLSGTIPVLCAKGQPGVGKTFLSSIVIHELESSFSNDQDDTAIIFAYCRYTDQHTIPDILASFIKQLADNHSRVVSSFELVHKKHLMNATQPIKQEWLELLQTAVSLFARVYIVIDALDEFPDNARDDLIIALLSLKANLLITSRPSNAFHLLRDVEYIEIGSENEQDIELFIHQEFKESSNLASLLKDKEQVRHQVCTKLKEISKSMFLVAALQIESLKNSTTVNQLRKATNSLSWDIDVIYSASWGRIKAQSKERALLAEGAIIWLTYAHRPLKITELQHALAVQCDAETFDNDDVANEDIIVSVCCGLLVVDRESQIARLVHFTALNFFKNLGRDLCSAPHTLISTLCLSYLSASKFTTDKLSTRKELDVFLRAEEYPLRDYAYRHWGFHAARCYEEGNGLPNAVSEFLLHCVPYPCKMEGRNFDLFERCHLAVYYGLRDGLALSNEWCNLLTPLKKTSPLMLACDRGNVDIIKLIFSHNNADINARNKNGQTALMWASRNGRDAAVRLLLSQTGIAVNTQAEGGRTALMLASQNGHDEVVKLLLTQIDITVNTQDEDGSTALMLASRNGHAAVVNLLLSQTDIAINTQANNFWTALMLASRNGHVAVVKLLLSQTDIAVNTQAEDGWTALMLASRIGHNPAIELLLSQTDIAVNTQTTDGWTALMLASRNGHVAVVKLLLSQTDIAVNKQTTNGWTALMLASRNAHIAVVKLLLSKTDIAINTETEESHTALTLASQNGHDAIVRLLLSQTDIAINTETKRGYTALKLAFLNGHDTVVKQLRLTKHGQTVLTMAAQNGHDTVVKLLSDTGGSTRVISSP